MNTYASGMTFGKPCKGIFVVVDHSSLPLFYNRDALPTSSLTTQFIDIFHPCTNGHTKPWQPPLLVPVDSDLYNYGFRSDLIPPSAPGTTRPVPYSSSHGLYVSVPAVHPLTILLFALGLEPNPNDLAYQMLPTCVESFPTPQRWPRSWPLPSGRTNLNNASV
ncbi:hypothetical protein BDZ89DRAFT_560667 [Hymenopellis radicata]|nr:hypothetical protein BDZ89DRAFT_560667 [Hymenopellis radicata]